MNMPPPPAAKNHTKISSMITICLRSIAKESMRIAAKEVRTLERLNDFNGTRPVNCGVSFAMGHGRNKAFRQGMGCVTAIPRPPRAPTMPRHIRDFYVTFARKFKLNNDPSCPDNKKNDRHLQTVCIFCAITSLLVKLRKSLHMAFEDDTSVEDTRPFLRFYRN